ncbi:MAG: hypothetical protein ABIG90_00320 [bacterium]
MPETPQEKEAREKLEKKRNTTVGKLGFLVVLCIILYTLIFQNNLNIKFIAWSILILIIITLLMVIVSIIKLCIESYSENY